MIHKPKILYNPTGEEIEFMCGGQLFIFAPGEKRQVEGFPAYHALNEVHTGLVEYDGQDSNPEALPLEDMKWRDLVSLGSKLKVFKPPMNKEQLIKAIKDGPEEGTLQEPISQEEV